MAASFAAGMLVPTVGSAEAAVTQNAQATESTQTPGNTQTTENDQTVENTQTTENGQTTDRTQESTNSVTKKLSVGKVKYSKNYKLKNGKVYFAVKGAFPTIKDQSEAAKKINAALSKEKKKLIDGWKKYAPQ